MTDSILNEIPKTPVGGNNGKRGGALILLQEDVIREECKIAYALAVP